MEEFVFQFDSLTFEDVDVYDSLSYSAALTTGGLPAWLSFNDATRTFSGTPTSDDKDFYNVIVTATDKSLASVSDTFEIHITGPVNIIDLAEEWKMSIYPNPGNGIFYVTFYLPENEGAELRILSLGGRLIWSEKYEYHFGEVILTVNLSDYPQGVYIVNIVTKSGVASKQIILQ